MLQSAMDERITHKNSHEIRRALAYLGASQKVHGWRECIIVIRGLNRPHRGAS